MEALKALKDGRPIRAMGLMSGTSLDGVDAALIETDGESHVEVVAHTCIPYKNKHRKILQDAVAFALEVDEKRPDAAEILAAEKVLTKTHAKAIAKLDLGDIDLVGFHGQTVLHRPDRLLTWQIGDGAALADKCGFPVIYDFRHKDVAAGGQGAPLAPIFHAALLRKAGLGREVGVVNIGGVANVTLLDDDDLLAFDTGPGNGLLDQWVERHDKGRFDYDGRLAAAGNVNAEALGRLLANSYFQIPAPKSLDRYDFTLDAVKGLSVEDGAATLTAFTAETIAKGIAQSGHNPRKLIVGGGGAQNPVLMDMIANATGIEIVGADSIGWNADALEAQCFAYLAARSARGLPLSYPGTTGVADPQTGGRLVFPAE